MVSCTNATHTPSIKRYEPDEEIIEFEACELQPDYLENLIEIRKTLAGRLALELDDEKKNRYWRSNSKRAENNARRIIR